MAEEITKDLLKYDEHGQPILPSGINVLTILTFIGCAFWGIITLLTPMLNKFAMSMIEKGESAPDVSAKKLADLEKAKAALELGNQNLIPNMAIGIVGIVLCFIGALWMRKYKKDGYWMYVAGELAPIVGGLIIMGTAQFTSAWSYVLIGISLLFIILYAMQRKYLTK